MKKTLKNALFSISPYFNLTEHILYPKNKMLGYKHLPVLLEGKMSRKDFAKVEEYASRFNNAKTHINHNSERFFDGLYAAS